MTAPICPISHTEIKPLPKTIVDAIRRIPRATDLKSAITAINRINNVIVQITRMPPQVNNTFNPRPPGIPGTPGVNTPARANNGSLTPADWIQESRTYQTRSIVNPDDTSQKIDVKVLVQVNFQNQNTGYRLQYKN